MSRWYAALSLLFIFLFCGCTKGDTTYPKTAYQAANDTYSSYNYTRYGIAFEYPADFRVYIQDDGSIRVDSDYKNADGSKTYLGMNIERIALRPESTEQLENRLSPSGRSISGQETRMNYELLKINDDEYYLVSGGGTFYIGISMDLYRTTLERQGFYARYRLHFNRIINSLRITDHIQASNH